MWMVVTPLCAAKECLHLSCWVKHSYIEVLIWEEFANSCNVAFPVTACSSVNIKHRTGKEILITIIPAWRLWLSCFKTGFHSCPCMLGWVERSIELWKECYDSKLDGGNPISLCADNECVNPSCSVKHYCMKNGHIYLLGSRRMVKKTMYSKLYLCTQDTLWNSAATSPYNVIYQ